MDASVELIRAIFDRLKASSAVTDFIGQRIFDRVTDLEAVPFPYVSLGPSTAVPNDFDCMQGEDITVQLDVWTSGAGEAYGSVQCRKLCGAIKKALHDIDLALPTNALVTLQHEITRVTDDPNPAINHGVVQFTATVETP